MLSILARQSRPHSAAYSGERAVNLFLRPGEGMSQAVLLSRGGLVEHVDLGTGDPVRAGVVMGDAMYFCSGGAVWKVQSGVASQVGSVPDGETHMAANITQVSIVVDGRYFVCDGAATTEYSTGAVDTPVGLTYADGYMVVIGAGTGLKDILQISALDNATSFNASEFAAAEYSSDGLVGAILDHGQVYLFGETTVEPFYNSGAVEFPFTPSRGSVMEHGCMSGKTIAKGDSAVYWVRPDGAVLRTLGASPEVISTPEVKEAIEGSTVLGGFMLSERGHEFYAVTREGKTTLVYDVITRLWHERADGLDYDPWRATSQVTLSGVQYFGCNNGKIATLSSSAYDDFGGYLAREFETQLSTQGSRPYVISRLQILVDSSAGDIGRTAQAMVQVSKNGRTWGREKWRDIAGAGQFSKRASWHALGQFDQGKIRFRVTDAVKCDVIGGTVDYG